MVTELRTCPGCGANIPARGNGVLYPHHSPRTGRPCESCDDAADTDDQWMLILREELGFDFAAIGRCCGLTSGGARTRYHGARRRENARVQHRGWA